MYFMAQTGYNEDMKIEISSKKLDLIPSITEYVEDKMGLLAKLVQKLELEGDLHLKVHIGRTTAHHHKGEVYEATADLALPGAHLRAQETDEDMRAAIDAVKETMEREIRKYKTKRA
jgi:putative sigma-54 modulation protein